MMKSKLLSFAGFTGLSCLVVPAALGQLHPNLTLDGFTTVFVEDFSSAPVGLVSSTEYTGGWSTFSGGVGTNGNNALEIVADTDNLFGGGATNKVLRSDGAKGWTLTYNIPVAAQQTVAAFSFDMRHLGTQVLGSSGTGTNETNRLTTRFFVNDALNQAPLNFGLQHRTNTEYRVRDEEDTRRTADPLGIVHFDVIVNNSLETFLFNNGEKSLAPGQSAVWINGAEAVASYAFGATAAITGETIKYFDMRTFSNNPWAAEFDNFTVSAIPEPSTYAFCFGLIALAGAAYIRRRRR